MMEYVREKDADPARVAPVPANWSFSRVEKQLQVAIHADYLPRYKLIFDPPFAFLF